MHPTPQEVFLGGLFMGFAAMVFGGVVGRLSIFIFPMGRGRRFPQETTEEKEG